jgi:DEAD/DEAH box helicase
VQTYDVIAGYIEALKSEAEMPHPELRLMLCIGELLPHVRPRTVHCVLAAGNCPPHGRVSLLLAHGATYFCAVHAGGVDLRPQMDLIKSGVHIVVATPGRLKDLLHKKRLNLDTCSYLCLDEADRMVDLGFEDDVRDVS